MKQHQSHENSKPGYFGTSHSPKKEQLENEKNNLPLKKPRRDDDKIDSDDEEE